MRRRGAGPRPGPGSGPHRPPSRSPSPQPRRPPRTPGATTGGLRLSEYANHGARLEAAPASSSPASSSPASSPGGHGHGGGLLSGLRRAFLPEGYPDSVAPEYLAFQLWDTTQATCSYVRGMLVTHALMSGVGVVDGAATALGATAVWFMRDFTSMLGGILFAFYQGTRLDGYAKQWRLFADLCNNFGMALELASPHAGRGLFLPLACAGATARALTGVAAGATRAVSVLQSRLGGAPIGRDHREPGPFFSPASDGSWPGSFFFPAVCGFVALTSIALQKKEGSLPPLVKNLQALTSHFALAGNAADVAAKEGSQETATTLLGMILGMALLRAAAHWGPLVSWASFAALTALHVGANVAAVRSLRLRTVNPERARWVFVPLRSCRWARARVCVPLKATSCRSEFDFQGSDAGWLCALYPRSLSKNPNTHTHTHTGSCLTPSSRPRRGPHGR